MPEVIKPPNSFVHLPLPTIFLMGSIEMGAAENWQEKITPKLLNCGYNVLNPRRDDWDSSWKQSINNPEFYKQVNWEISGLNRASAVLVYFDPNTKSPITLLELGYLLGDKGRRGVIVVCPDGFWRKGNVEIVCERGNFLLLDSLDDAITLLESVSL